jgi:hypothetical protein
MWTGDKEGDSKPVGSKDSLGLGRRVTLYNSIICLGILAYSMLAILFPCERHLPRKELLIQNTIWLIGQADIQTGIGKL